MKTLSGEFEHILAAPGSVVILRCNDESLLQELSVELSRWRNGNDVRLPFLVVGPGITVNVIESGVVELRKEDGKVSSGC